MHRYKHLMRNPATWPLRGLVVLVGFGVAEQDALVSRGRAESVAGQHTLALEPLEVAVSLDPTRTGPWAELGAACRRSGLSERAEVISQFISQVECQIQEEAHHAH